MSTTAQIEFWLEYGINVLYVERKWKKNCEKTSDINHEKGIQIMVREH